MSSDWSARQAEVDRGATLAAQVKALQRELEIRDEQLEVRAGVIRRLRQELADARESYERVVHSRSYRLASLLRRAAVAARPRELIRALRRRT